MRPGTKTSIESIGGANAPTFGGYIANYIGIIHVFEEHSNLSLYILILHEDIIRNDNFSFVGGTTFIGVLRILVISAHLILQAVLIHPNLMSSVSPKNHGFEFNTWRNSISRHLLRHHFNSFKAWILRICHRLPIESYHR